MATIDTPRRQFIIEIENANSFATKVKNFANENEITLDEAMEMLKHLAYERRTDVLIENGDFEDTQTGLISEGLNNIADNIEKVFYSLDKMAFSEK